MVVSAAEALDLAIAVIADHQPIALVEQGKPDADGLDGIAQAGFGARGIAGRLHLGADVGAGAAIALKPAGPVEDRPAAGPHMVLGPGSRIDQPVADVAERAPRHQVLQMPLARLGIESVDPDQLGRGPAQQLRARNARLGAELLGHVGQAQLRIGAPKPGRCGIDIVVNAQLGARAIAAADRRAAWIRLERGLGFLQPGRRLRHVRRVHAWPRYASWSGRSRIEFPK